MSVKPEDVRPGWWIIRDPSFFGPPGDELDVVYVCDNGDGTLIWESGDRFTNTVGEDGTEWLRGPLDLEALAAEAERDEMVKGFARWKRCECGLIAVAILAPPLTSFCSICTCGKVVVVTLDDMSQEAVRAIMGLQGEGSARPRAPGTEQEGA